MNKQERNACTRRASEIRPGESVWQDGWHFGWREVLRIEPILSCNRLLLHLEPRTKQERAEGCCLLVVKSDWLVSVRDEAHRLERFAEAARGMGKTREKSPPAPLTVTGNDAQNRGTEPKELLDAVV